MNDLVNFTIEDVQNLADVRQLAIDKVGIKAIRHPVTVKDKTGNAQHTVAMFNMYVHLPQHFKGTHMSRFVELLNANEGAISVENFHFILQEMAIRLEAQFGHIEMTFPYFINKSAPVSGVKSLLDYEVTFIGEISHGHHDIKVKMLIPVTSLCPCSKKISAYGAHNQRSHVTVTISLKEFMWIEDMIAMVEAQASSELYGLLKRPDEKYVTELAYDNPKFVEDMVRDIATAFNNEPRVKSYIVECENFESIHNHSAYACISSENTKKSQHKTHKSAN
ncbi:MAG: GTP cyclohydrolase FolE2, partial [Methylotenera sp.]